MKFSFFVESFLYHCKTVLLNGEVKNDFVISEQPFLLK